MSRRGLLGLMAAAPVALVAKPAAAKHGPFIGMDFGGDDLSASGWFIREGDDFRLMAIEGERYALLRPETVERLASPIFNHPPAGLSHSRADDEGPGASARASGCRSRPVSEALTTEAPAPDEAMILKHARAC